MSNIYERNMHGIYIETDLHNTLFIDLLETYVLGICRYNNTLEDETLKEIFSNKVDSHRWDGLLTCIHPIYDSNGEYNAAVIDLDKPPTDLQLVTASKRLTAFSKSFDCEGRGITIKSVRPIEYSFNITFSK